MSMRELITLSPTEFDLLELLLQNKNIVLTRYQLNEYLCQDYSHLKQSNIVDVHIKNLEKKDRSGGVYSYCQRRRLQDQSHDLQCSVLPPYLFLKPSLFNVRLPHQTSDASFLLIAKPRPLPFCFVSPY